MMTLFHRCLLFTVSVATLASILTGLVLGLIEGELGFVRACVACILAGLSGFAAWISLTARPIAPGPDTRETDLPPKLDGQKLVVDYPGLGTQDCRITVDFVSKTIRFENSHTARRFLARASQDFTCPLRDILNAHEHTYIDSDNFTQLTIVTRHGKALVPEGATNYGELCRLAAQISELTPPGPIADHPAAMYYYLAGALAGMAAGWAVTPGSASDNALAGYLLGGAVTGVVATALLLRLFNRAASSRLAMPVALGAIGAVMGLCLAIVMPSAQAWGWLKVASSSGKGAVIGIALGYCLQMQTRSGLAILGASTGHTEQGEQPT